MEKQKAISLIKILTLNDAVKILGTKSEVAAAVGDYPQNFNRWIDKKLIATYDDKYELVPDNEFWRGLL